MRRPLPGQGLSYGREPRAQRWKWGHQRFRSNHTLHIRTFRGSRGLWRTCQPTLLAPLPETPPEPQGPWDSPGQSWKGLEGHPAPPLQLPEVQLPEVQLPEELGPRAPGSWWEGPAERQQWEGIGKWGSEMLKTAVTGLWWIDQVKIRLGLRFSNYIVTVINFSNTGPQLKIDFEKSSLSLKSKLSVIHVSSLCHTLRASQFPNSANSSL